MSPQGKIWRRRALLMFVVALLVAIPATILIRGGDDDGNEAPVSTVVDPELNAGVNDRSLDVSYQVPKGWKESKKAKAIQLQSGDRSVLIAIAAPADASESGPLLDDTLGAIRSGYRNVKVDPGSGRKVGGLNAKGAVIQAKTSDGNELRILVAVAKGKKRAYLVEVFTAANAPAERIAEAQVALNSLRLEG